MHFVHYLNTHFRSNTLSPPRKMYGRLLEFWRRLQHWMTGTVVTTGLVELING